jgi:Spy/CpxP family protein refolding chaperone
MVEARIERSATAAAAPLVRWMVMGVLVIAAASAAVSAHAQGHGPGMGGHGSGPGMMMFNGPPEHIERMVDHMLDGLGATDAQRGQIKQIAQAAAADLKVQHDGSRGLRDKGMQIFAAPTIDAAAAESLRQQMQAQHEQASKRVLQAMLDVGKVLTPEQRAKIGERMKQRQTMMQDRMQRMQGKRGMRGERPKP